MEVTEIMCKIVLYITWQLHGSETGPLKKVNKLIFHLIEMRMIS